MLELHEEAGQVLVREVFRVSKEVFSSEQQTPVFHRGFVYGVLSKEAGASREQLVCLDPSGKQVWSSGRENRFGPTGGPYMIAQGMIFVMNDDGVLTLAEANPSGYRQLARAKVVPGRESWAPLALVGGRLLVRDKTHLACLDLRAESYGR
jgi:outer membrane protein assembly factor BamB